MGEAGEIDELRREIARLAAENEELRARFRIGPASSENLATPKEETRGIAVLLAPDPAEERRPGGLGPQAVANLSRTIVDIMGRRRPDLEWRAEHDLERIPRAAICFQLGASGGSPDERRRTAAEDVSGGSRR